MSYMPPPPPPPQPYPPPAPLYGPPLVVPEAPGQKGGGLIKLAGVGAIITAVFLFLMGVVVAVAWAAFTGQTRGPPPISPELLKITLILIPIGLIILGVGFIGWGTFYKKGVAYAVVGLGIASGALWLVTFIPLITGAVTDRSAAPSLGGLFLVALELTGSTLISLGVTFFLTRHETGKPALAVISFVFGLIGGIMFCALIPLFIFGVGFFMAGVGLILCAIAMFTAKYAPAVLTVPAMPVPAYMPMPPPGQMQPQPYPPYFPQQPPPPPPPY